MEFRGRTYLGVESATEQVMPEVAGDLRDRILIVEQRIRDVADAIAGGGGRIRIGETRPVANPDARIGKYRSGNHYYIRINATLGFLENISNAEMDAFLKHELVHLDQWIEGDRLERAAMAYAGRHGIIGRGLEAMENHYWRKRELDADRRSVTVYGADPLAAISVLENAVAMRRELGLRMDYEACDWHSTSPHPRTEMRVAQFQDLVRAATLSKLVAGQAAAPANLNSGLGGR